MGGRMRGRGEEEGRRMGRWEDGTGGGCEGGWAEEGRRNVNINMAEKEMTEEISKNYRLIFKIDCDLTFLYEFNNLIKRFVYEPHIQV